MPARLAYPMFYRAARKPLSEEGRLQFDAALGDAAAEREVQRRRMTALRQFGDVR